MVLGTIEVSKRFAIPSRLFFNKCHDTLYNNTMWFYRGTGHAILGHFKKRISKLNVIVRLLTKLRGAVLFLLIHSGAVTTFYDFRTHSSVI